MAFRYPPSEILWSFWRDIVTFVQRLHQVNRMVPIRVTSWWRSVQDNALAGGDEYSQHLLALAVDVQPLPPYAMEDVMHAARQVGLIPVRYTSHVHIQLHPAGFLRRLLGVNGSYAA